MNHPMGRDKETLLLLHAKRLFMNSTTKFLFKVQTPIEPRASSRSTWLIPVRTRAHNKMFSSYTVKEYLAQYKHWNVFLITLREAFYAWVYASHFTPTRSVNIPSCTHVECMRHGGLNFGALSALSLMMFQKLEKWWKTVLDAWWDGGSHEC